MKIMEMSAVELSAAIKEGKYTVMDAAQAALNNIKEKEEKYHCYITVDAKGAML